MTRTQPNTSTQTNMKTLPKLSGILAAGLVVAGTASAGLVKTATYDSGFANSGVIPDANPTGWADTRNFTSFSGDSWQITDVNVTITVNNGYNGDLYAYVSHAGVLVPLLNRVGKGSGSEPQYSFGWSTAGFSNVKLDDSGSASIHGVENPVSYVPPSGTTYQPDGGTLANFNNYNPNGNWTI